MVGCVDYFIPPQMFEFRNQLFVLCISLTLFYFTLFSAFVVKNKIQMVAALESHTLTVYILLMSLMFDQVLGLFVG